MNIVQLMSDRRTFGPWFRKKLLRGDSWAAWRVCLKAMFAIALTPEELAIYEQHTGRTDPPTAPVREAWLCCGRRSGKSLIASLIAVWAACFRSYDHVLAPGEYATIMAISPDRRQARVVMGYIKGFLAIPLLSRMVVNETLESITLSNRVRIEVHTASFRSLRGYSVALAILDECAFFPTGDSAEPDTEIVNALRPAMATIPDALLLGISSPYARRGVLWEAFREPHGKANAPVLFWRGATRDMNPTVAQATIALAYLKDAASAAAEYGAEFRSDVAKFIPIELVERAIVHPSELPPVPFVDYRGFCDPSGGASDSFALGIAHVEREKVILDVLRETVPPFSPERVIAEFCTVLKQYRCSEVVGDRYGGEFPRELFAKQGILYRVSEKVRSDLYLELLPLLTSGKVEFFEHPRLKAQLVALERRTGRGRDVIDHAPGSHDDAANSAAGAIVLAAQQEFTLGLVEFERQGGSTQALALDEPPKPKAITTVFSNDPFAVAPSRFPPTVPPAARQYDLSGGCSNANCQGELVVVEAHVGIGYAKCSKCGDRVQVHERSRFAPSPHSMTRAEFLQRQERQPNQFGRNRNPFGRFGGGFPPGLFGRFGR
jgi:hypothetical protein